MHNKILRFYSDPKPNTARVTVVGKYEDGILKMAVSRCSHKDTFTRERARTIAEGRLNKGKLYGEYLMDECKGADFYKKAKEIADEVQISKIVKW